MEVYGMNITTYIELENQEVEEIVKAKMIFSTEQINQQIIETCVEGFEADETGEKLSSEDAMEKVFDFLKSEGIIPTSVEDFSFEMPSCERLKKVVESDGDIPQNVIITYVL
jgi:hypothetical protein